MTFPTPGDKDRICCVKRPEENSTKKAVWGRVGVDKMLLYTRQLNGGGGVARGRYATPDAIRSMCSNIQDSKENVRFQ